MFHRVSNPQAIQQEISRRQHNKAERRAKYDARQQRQILGEYLGFGKWRKRNAQTQAKRAK